MILQLFGLMSQKPNIDMTAHSIVVLSYLTGQSHNMTLPTHVTLVCNAVQCLVQLLSRGALSLTGVTLKTLTDVCQLGLLHRTWEIRETFLRLISALMRECHAVCVQLKHVVTDKLRDVEPFVVMAALQIFQGLSREQWSEWHSHVIDALSQCLEHEDAAVRV